MANLENIRLLRDEMINRGWFMTVFKFAYNKYEYFVEVKRYLDNEIKPQFAIAKLCFLRANNLEDTFSAWANTVTVQFEDVKEFRTFFNIQYSNNLGNIVLQFIQYFGTKVPASIKLSAEENKILLRQLSKLDSEDPNKIYCFALRRNPLQNGIQSHRTLFNDQKARMLRPRLYKLLFQSNNDYTISFCFSAKLQDEKNDEEILRQFAANQK